MIQDVPATSATSATSAADTAGGAAVSGSRLRPDASLNRERILDAARAVFSEDGINGSIAEIARRAGVGMATVYRRFPTRDDLIECVFMQQLSAYVEIMNDALAHPDAWEGFRSCLEAICLMQAENRGFTDIMTTFAPRSLAMRADHSRAEALMSQVVKRARTTGRLRPDFRLEDIPLLLHANLGVVSLGPDRPDAWRRLVAYMLQAFEARNTEPLTVDRPGDADLASRRTFLLASEASWPTDY